MSKKRFLAGIMSLLLIITSVFTGNVVARAVTSSTIRFNDQTREGETSKAYEYGSVSYKIGTGAWQAVTSAGEIAISTTDTVYFRLIPNDGYEVDMVRNVELSSTKDSGSQTLAVQTDNEAGAVTGSPNAQYFMFTPELNGDTPYGYEICFGFGAASPGGEGPGGGRGCLQGEDR